jgi:hypothetical protein
VENGEIRGRKGEEREDRRERGKDIREQNEVNIWMNKPK